MFNIIGAMAQFEREIIRERTRAGVAFARSSGKVLGRPKTSVTFAQIAILVAEGLSGRAIAKRLNVSEGTIRKLLRKAA